jgi:hypothetical protein
VIIAPSVDLPDQVLQQHIAILGKTGSGKTFTAKGIVEKLIEAGRRVCVLDPTDAWWGLGAAGEGEGFPITVFGGPHGHVPISEHAGQALGRLVATKDLQCVISLRDMMVGEQCRFVERFMEQLYQHNTRPLHLVVDEADEFGPQNPGPDRTRMLGQFDRIARRGRTRGFRLMVITQRPAKLNKDILGQAATLISMQLTLPHDRKAVQAWVADMADPKEGREVLASLPKLRRGEGWVWCPDEGILQRTGFPTIRTFDSSSTPDDDDLAAAPAAPSLAEVDLSEIREAMSAAIEQAEDGDVRKLQAKVKDLKEQLARSLATPVSVAPEAMRELREDRDALQEMMGQQANTIRDLQSRLDRLRSMVITETDDVEVPAAAPAFLNGAMRREAAASTRLDRDPECGTVCCSEDSPAVSNPPAEDDALVTLPARSSGTYTNKTRAAQREGTDVRYIGTSGLTGPQQRLIDAIAWWMAVGIDDPARVQVGFIAGYTASSGTFRTLLSECRKHELIDYGGNGQVFLTVLGGNLANRPKTPGGLLELHRRVRERLTGPQQKVFDVLVGAGGAAIPREVVASKANYEVTSGTFRTLLSECRSLGLLHYPSTSTVQASSVLFPERMRR